METLENKAEVTQGRSQCIKSTEKEGGGVEAVHLF